MIAIGAGIAIALFVVRSLAAEFGPGTTTVDHPWKALVGLLVGAGLLWTALLPVLRRLPRGRVSLPIIILSGLALRALFLGSTPIYENDFNRYLWDGAVTAQGLDPFALSPSEARLSADPDIAALRARSGNLLSDINNAELTTIYPGTAQGAFALAHWIGPFDVEGLRRIFLLSELAAMLLLAAGLRQFGRDPQWTLLYALCPLAVFAGFNTLHMDLLLAPFLLGALWLIARRPALAAISLALAAGVKVWPLLLAPVLYRGWLSQPVRLAGYALIVSVVSLALFAPMLLAIGPDSGLAAYSTGWNRSALLFPLLENALGIMSSDPGRVARILVAATLGVGAVALGWVTRNAERTHLPGVMLGVSAALLFLSPTGYPWYGVWLLPLLPFAPRYGLCALLALLPIHYARFAFGEAGNYAVYLDVLVPIQFGVPLTLLALEAAWGLHRNRKDRRHAAPALAWTHHA